MCVGAGNCANWCCEAAGEAGEGCCDCLLNCANGCCEAAGEAGEGCCDDDCLARGIMFFMCVILGGAAINSCLVFYFAAILSDSGNADLNKPFFIGILPSLCISRGVFMILECLVIVFFLVLQCSSINKAGFSCDQDGGAIVGLFVHACFACMDLIGGVNLLDLDAQAFSDSNGEVTDSQYKWLVLVAASSYAYAISTLFAPFIGFAIYCKKNSDGTGIVVRGTPVVDRV
jgi:hypothetical protein